jgi:hypothetical protein
MEDGASRVLGILSSDGTGEGVRLYVAEQLIEAGVGVAIEAIEDVAAAVALFFVVGDVEFHEDVVHLLEHADAGGLGERDEQVIDG